jgi:hypothetical protein
MTLLVGTDGQQGEPNGGDARLTNVGRQSRSARLPRGTDR